MTAAADVAAMLRPAKASPVPGSGTAYISSLGYLDEPFVGRLMVSIHQAVEAGASSVHLLLHCMGGSEQAATSLYTTLVALQGVRIVATNIGTLGSAGIPAFLGASARYACPTSTFLFHGALVPPKHLVGEYKFLTESHLRMELDRIVASNARLAGIYRTRCAGLQDADTIAPLMGLPVPRTPQWALDHGVIHAIRAPRIPRDAWHTVAVGATDPTTTVSSKPKEGKKA